MNYQQIFPQYKQPALFGRYIHPDTVENLVTGLKGFSTGEAGRSVLGKPIYLCKIGTGKTKILLWSQMHGNETTTTKAVFDFFKFLSKSPSAVTILQTVTLYAIPMLNPDGAEAYTRVNANGVDLNRDFCNLSQPESQLLNAFFLQIKPDYCFNMHDQRTIFGAGDSGKPATVSFLAPAYNEQRDVNAVRLKAINAIVVANKVLQEIIPGGVGRFDDSFNINCAGDSFQARNAATILFEAGHFPDDYNREVTRMLIFTALCTITNHIGAGDMTEDKNREYLHIPQNKINFCDFKYKNVRLNYDNKEIITNFAAQYTEELSHGEIILKAKILEVGELNDRLGHFEYDAQGSLFSSAFERIPMQDEAADFKLGSVEFKNGKPVTVQKN